MDEIQMNRRDERLNFKKELVVAVLSAWSLIWLASS
jgi:hypothetical protein